VIDVLQGGMGVVYICHQAATDQLYAVKTVRFDVPQERLEESVQRFQGEVNSWIRVSTEARSDKIVRALTFDADERLLILECIDGLPLNKLGSPARPLHPQHALAWASDIAEGMDVLHSKFRLLHRDLKPQNVLVARKDLTAKITDLGIVKTLDDDDGAMTRIGTPAYMAPECFEGRTDFRSDIFSFGATLFWMLTGRRASTGDASQTSALPPRMRQNLERCLKRDPEERYQSFAELREDLSRVDAADFVCQEEHYKFCSEHRLYSPVSPDGKDIPCLFCEQEADLKRKLNAAGEATDPTITVQMGPVKVGDGSPGEGSPTLPLRTSPLQTIPLALARIRRPGIPRWAAFVLLGVLCLGVLGYFGGAGIIVSKTLPTASAGICTDDDCLNPVAPVSDKYTKHREENPGSEGWEPVYCAAHSPWECAVCYRRENTEPSDQSTCGCGEKGSSYSYNPISAK